MKCTLLTALMLILLVHVQAQIPTSGLVAYYPFNGSATDASGKGHDGSPTDVALAADRSNNLNSAYSFNGSSSNVAVSNFRPSANSFSFSLWINKPSYPTSYQVVFSDAGIYRGTRLFFQNDKLYFDIQQGNTWVAPPGRTRQVTIPTSKFSADTWYHIAGMSINGTMSIYLNGVLQQTATDFLADDGSQLFGIGYESFMNTGFFNGSIDDIRFYDRALTDAEIQALYHENGWTGNADISLHWPTSGAIWAVGSTQYIKWSASNIDYVQIDLSTNGGITWEPLTFTGWPAALGVFPWKVQEAYKSTNCKIRVRDAAASVASAESSPFAIEGKTLWVSGYYPADKDGEMPPDKIDLSTVTHVLHFALVPDVDTVTQYPYGLDDAKCTRLHGIVETAKRKLLVSVADSAGRSTPSRFIEATSDQNRSTFIHKLLAWVDNHHYDGVDIDWEGLHENSLDYVPNLVQFISELRDSIDAFHPGLLLTTAIGWDVADPLYATLAEKVDQFNIMTYDLANTVPGNPALGTWHDSAIKSHDGSHPSLTSIVQNFEAIGIPAAKIGIGVPFYGIQWKGGLVKGTSDGVTDTLQEWETANPPADTGYTFAHIMDKFYPESHSRWDATYQAAYLSHNAEGNVEDYFVSYDDEQACQRKVDFVKEKALGGMILWNLWQGYWQGSQPLVSAIGRAITGDYSRRIASQTQSVAGPGLVSFSTGSYKTGIELNFVSVSSPGIVAVDRYSDPPLNVTFDSTPLQNTSQYRWVITESGLGSFSTEVRFNLADSILGVTQPSSVTVYKRPAQGTGVFIACATSYDSVANQLIARVTSFSEFILASNDNPLTGLTGAEQLPRLISLDQNYPNPFNPTTTIGYALPSRVHVTLTVYNVLGQQVAELVNGEIEAGYHEVRFNATYLASGVYFYRMQAGSYVDVKKLLLIR